MLKYIPLLAKINSAGYLTTESQAGHEKKTKTNTTMERAYICGFMLESTAADFIKYMGLYTDKNAGQLIGCGDYDLFKGEFDIPLTATKLNTGEIQVDTHMAMGLPAFVYEKYRKEAKINKAEKVVFVQCWDPLWKRNAAGTKGLFTEVLKILIMLSGLQTRKK